MSSFDLAEAYHDRGEVEVTFDEIKTHQRGGAVVLRSKLPDLILQELYGYLITHYGVRQLMTEAADQAELDPDRSSFTRSLNIIRRQVTSQVAFSPQTLAAALVEAVKEINSRPNRKRRERTCPRVVKRARHNSYRVKRAHHKTIRHTDLPRIQIMTPAA